jgi:hypothetical protein
MRQEINDKKYNRKEKRDNNDRVKMETVGKIDRFRVLSCQRTSKERGRSILCPTEAI